MAPVNFFKYGEQQHRLVGRYPHIPVKVTEKMKIFAQCLRVRYQVLFPLSSIPFFSRE